jgi:hypothetical protein
LSFEYPILIIFKFSKRELLQELKLLKIFQWESNQGNRMVEIASHIQLFEVALMPAIISCSPSSFGVFFKTEASVGLTKDVTEEK